MSGSRKLGIDSYAFNLALNVHKASLLLPHFELFEQGSQIRRSSKSIKDHIAEGYGRRRYKADFIKFLVYARASCDETLSQLKMINALYKSLYNWEELIEEYTIPGKKINTYFQFIEMNR